MDKAEKPLPPGKPDEGDFLYDIWAASQYTGIPEHFLRYCVEDSYLETFQSEVHGNTWVFRKRDLDRLKAALENDLENGNG